MNAWPGIVGVSLVMIATLSIGTWGLRVSRTTSDFFVASRSVNPRLNAHAIGGEYLSAASFLGIAGLLLTQGAEMLWYPVGWTAGYLVLLVLVAAPLRRSGAYTLPDFAEARLGSRRLRALCSVMLVGIGWLYLVPQLEGAGLTIQAILGVDQWVGAVLVAAVVLANVATGGMKSVTFVQAFQYWLKLTALLIPAMVLLVVWFDDGRPRGLGAPADWGVPLAGGPQGLYLTYSLILATFCGTMGLPHVVVRFYTNPNGRDARRTTLVVLTLLAAFYVLPPVFGALGRVYGADRSSPDTLVLQLPGLMVDGLLADVLTGLVAAGAFAAFLSTSSGLAIALAGVLSQDLVGRGWTVWPWRGRRPAGIASFRIGAVIAVLVPLVATVAMPNIGVARVVGLAFATAASTFCPLLVLGIWWRGLTAAGAAAGLVAGFVGCGVAVGWAVAEPTGHGWVDAVLSQPAAWTVPLAFAVMIVVSRAGSPPLHADRLMLRLHTPESVSR